MINSQLGRRNIADIDRIMLVSKWEEILRRKAKANQSAAGKQTSLGRKFCDVVLALAPKAATPINSRKELAAEAGVGEHTYDTGKAILDAVAGGSLGTRPRRHVVSDAPAGHWLGHFGMRHLEIGNQIAVVSETER